jgi:hypothetical protein
MALPFITLILALIIANQRLALLISIFIVRRPRMFL